MAESAVTVAFWCLLALAFNGLIWWWMGGKAGLQFCNRLSAGMVAVDG